MRIVESVPSPPGEVLFARSQVRDGAVLVGSVSVAAGCIWLGAQQPEHRLTLAWGGFWAVVVALWAIYLIRISRHPDAWRVKVVPDGLYARLGSYLKRPTPRSSEPKFVHIPKDEVEAVGLVREIRVFYQREEKMTTRHICLELHLKSGTDLTELDQALTQERDRRPNTSLFYHFPVVIDSPQRIRIDLTEIQGGADAVMRSLKGYRNVAERRVVDDMTERQDYPKDHILKVLAEEGDVRARILARKIYRMKDTEIRDLLDSES